jgi:hypothetical protein
VAHAAETSRAGAHGLARPAEARGRARRGGTR